MKNLLIFLFLCSNVAFAQVSKLDTKFGTATLDVTQLEAFFAKSAQVETKSDKVIVFLTEKEKDSKIGLNVAVTSAAKFKAMFAIKKSVGDFIPLDVKTNGDFYFFGTPGKYTLVLSESDPEKGQSFSSVEGEIIGSGTKPPIDPPVGNFDKLIEVTKQASDKMSDKDTSKALGNAYKKAVVHMKSLTKVEDCEDLARSYRRVVFAAIPREKRNLDWNSFILSIDPELKQFRTSVELYSAALSAVAESLISN